MVQIKLAQSLDTHGTSSTCFPLTYTSTTAYINNNPTTVTIERQNEILSQKMSPNPSQPKGEKRIVFLQADSVFCQGVSPLCSILFIIENFIIKQGQTELLYFGGPWEIFRFYGILIHTVIILQIKNNSKPKLSSRPLENTSAEQTKRNCKKTITIDAQILSNL